MSDDAKLANMEPFDDDGERIPWDTWMGKLSKVRAMEVYEQGVHVPVDLAVDLASLEINGQQQPPALLLFSPTDTDGKLNLHFTFTADAAERLAHALLEKAAELRADNGELTT